MAESAAHINAAKASPVYMEDLTLNGDDITAKFKDLSQAPANASQVQLDVDGGPRQINGVDYVMIVSPARISWDGYNLDTVLEAGETLSLIYSI